MNEPLVPGGSSVTECALGPDEWVLLCPWGRGVPDSDVRGLLQAMDMPPEPESPSPVLFRAVTEVPLGLTLLHYRAGQATVYCSKGTPDRSREAVITEDGASALTELSQRVAGSAALTRMSFSLSFRVEAVEHDSMPPRLRPVACTMSKTDIAVAVSDDRTTPLMAEVLTSLGAAQIRRLAGRAAAHGQA